MQTTNCTNHHFLTAKCADCVILDRCGSICRLSDCGQGTKAGSLPNILWLWPIFWPIFESFSNILRVWPKKLRDESIFGISPNTFGKYPFGKQTPQNWWNCQFFPTSKILCKLPKICQTPKILVKVPPFWPKSQILGQPQKIGQTFSFGRRTVVAAHECPTT